MRRTPDKETKMPTAAQMVKIRRLARAEIANPVGAFDEIRADGRHPLAHMLDKTTPPFFQQLAHRAAAEIDHPTGRYGNNHQYVASLLGKEPTMPRYRHPLLARDQAMPSNAVSGLDQEPGGAPSGEECLQFVRLCMAKLAGPDRDEFVQGLAELLGTEEPGNDNAYLSRTAVEERNGNGPNGNRSAMDRGRRGAGDRRPGAMDSAIRGMNTANFLKRFPMANVSFSGTGR
jgi:hypothetical protein